MIRTSAVFYMCVLITNNKFTSYIAYPGVGLAVGTLVACNASSDNNNNNNNNKSGLL